MKVSDVTLLRTSDMTLAALINFNGVKPTRMELRDDETACWVFEGALSVQLQREYEAGVCRVEPRAFTRELFRTRGQLILFLRSHGVKPKPKSAKR